MEQLIWLSYDLGVDGDYNGLYTWLDSNKARECGDSIAAIMNYQYESDISTELLKDLKESVKLRKSDRIYLIYKKDGGDYKGKFLYGHRKRSPWEGYAVGSEEESEDE
jgi:hypothetical protein